MSAAAPWLLSARITRWCLLVGTGFVALLAVVGCVLVHLETRQELDAIVEEELEELVDSFAKSEGTREAFSACAAELHGLHPDDAMAWRVWQRADGSEWRSFGRTDLLAYAPAKPAETPRLPGSFRWRTAELNGELEVGLLLEGGREVASERTFQVVAASVVAFAAVISFLSGRFLGGRVGSALRRIAAETRAGSAAQVGSLPAEMRDVVAALQEAVARIRDESDKARLLASGLAHELRSPLHNLLLQAEVALLREREPCEYRSALGLQIAELQELIRAVDNLVTLCAPPEARRARHEECFDLAAETRLRLRAEEQRAARASVTLAAEVPPSLPVRGDRESLMLALRNLVANALDWSPPGGRVEVRIAEDARGVRIEVDDQGPGVPESERERIFLPFERGPARPDGRIGYGLGLALVRTVVGLHRGTVHVGGSRLGGASFRVDLPLQ